jgi:integrase
VKLQAKKRKRSPKRAEGERYDVHSYRRAIARACEVAFPVPEHLERRRLPDGTMETRAAWLARLTAVEKAEVRVWRRQHSWHPHQLRHNAATRLRKEYGIEAARVVLGHRSAAITEVYAEIDHAKAADIMLKVG